MVKALILGTTREEMHAFLVADPVMASPDVDATAERFAALAGSADAIEAYRGRRDLPTYHGFQFPQLELEERLVRAGRRVFLYQFDWAPPASARRVCQLFGMHPCWPGWTRANMPESLLP